MNPVLEKLKGGLIVSCQASPGWPLYGSENMQKMAIAATVGGAAGIRACWPGDIAAVKEVTSLPIIGVNKIYSKQPTAADVIITPSFEAAVAIIEAGCDIVGIDCTARGRSYEQLAEIIFALKKHYPDIPLMGDLSTLEEGLMAAKFGVDILSTTLSGYTNTSLGISEEEARQLSSYPEGQEPPPDYELIKQLRRQTDKLINAEGRFWEIGEVKEAFRLGADMITIGSAITAPQLITKRFAYAVKEVTETN